MPIRKAFSFGTMSLLLVLLMMWLVGVAPSRERVPESTSKSDALTDLEERIGNLQYAPLFVVVDRQDKPIFTVTSSDYWSAASVFNSNGQDVVSMGANTDGGYFSVRSDDGSTKARLGIDQEWAGLRISERVSETVTEKGVTRDVIRDAPRIELGGQAGGNYSLKFQGSAGLLAGIGESKAGTGAIVIGDSKGRKRASMLVGDEGKGLIGIFNAGGHGVAVLGEAVGNSGGSLVIGDAKSEPRVKMGTNDNRYGVVMTFPLGFPYVPKSGLPGSYMLGCAGGPSCVP